MEVRFLPRAQYEITRRFLRWVILYCLLGEKANVFAFVENRRAELALCERAGVESPELVEGTRDRFLPRAHKP